jgi:hypothetical protein
VQTRAAERYIALEYLVALVLRTVAELRRRHALPGARTYVNITVTYGLLSLFTFSEVTASIGPGVGGLVLLALLVRPPIDPATGRPVPGGTTPGQDVLEGITEFAASTAHDEAVDAVPHPAGVGSAPQAATHHVSSSGRGAAGGGGIGDLFTQVLLSPGYGASAALKTLDQLPSVLFTPGKGAGDALNAALDWLGL